MCSGLSTTKTGSRFLTVLTLMAPFCAPPSPGADASLSQVTFISNTNMVSPVLAFSARSFASQSVPSTLSATCPVPSLR